MTSERESPDSGLSHGSYEKGAYQYTKRQGVPLSGHKEQTYVKKRKKTRFERDQHKSSAASEESDLPKIERTSMLKIKMTETPENGSSETSDSAGMYNI